MESRNDRKRVRKMNILFVCMSLGNGGAERVVSILSGVLQNSEHDIFVLPLNTIEHEYEFDNNVHIIKTDNRYRLEPIKKIRRILDIRRAIRNNRIDVVISFSSYNIMYTVIAATNMHVKIIGSERNDPKQDEKRKVYCFFKFKLYKKLSCMVCQTNDASEYFQEQGILNTKVILNPILDSLPMATDVKNNRKIVSFSRLEEQKNIPMLIDAFYQFYQTHKDYSLEIYGNGSLKNDIIEHVNSMGLERIVFIYPFCTDIHKKILSSRMFALASNYEGLSNSMIEAMACGIPTIVTDCPCGGARMVITDKENGILVPVGDVEEMSRAMTLVADDDDLARKLSANGTLIRETLEKNKIAKQWISTIEKVVAQVE